MIQMVMLVSLGFLCASLFALVVAPGMEAVRVEAEQKNHQQLREFWLQAIDPCFEVKW